jgi:hypothetical protein
MEPANHTYNREACSFFKILLKTDAVWNFSRHTLDQAAVTTSSENCKLVHHFALDVMLS